MVKFSCGWGHLIILLWCNDNMGVNSSSGKHNHNEHLKRKVQLLIATCVRVLLSANPTHLDRVYTMNYTIYHILTYLYTNILANSNRYSGINASPHLESQGGPPGLTVTANCAKSTSRSTSNTMLGFLRPKSMRHWQKIQRLHLKEPQLVGSLAFSHFGTEQAKKKSPFGFLNLSIFDFDHFYYHM